MAVRHLAATWWAGCWERCPPEDQELVDDAIVRATDSILYLLEEGVDRAMNKVN